MNLPARYAKFITALAGSAVGYLTAYGTTWNLQGALVVAGAALAVLGVPNAPAPVTPAMAAQPSNVVLVQPGVSGKGMFVDPQQVPTDLKQPATQPGQPPA